MKTLTKAQRLALQTVVAAGDHGAWPVRGVSCGTNVNARAAASLRGLGLVTQRPPYFTRVLLTDKGQEVLDA